MEKERRFVPIDGIEVRKADDGTPKGIAGMGAVFGARTTIAGRFEEEIADTFFDGVLSDPGVMGLFNHNPDYVLGRTGAGTMTLRKERGGIHYEVPELPKSRADVLESVARRDVTGNSFSFSMPEDGSGEEWIRAEDRTDGGKLPLRILRRAAGLFDFGPVTYPAYKVTTVSARSEAKASELTSAEAAQLDEETTICLRCQEKDARIKALEEGVGRRDEMLDRLT